MKGAKGKGSKSMQKAKGAKGEGSKRRRGQEAVVVVVNTQTLARVVAQKAKGAKGKGSKRDEKKCGLIQDRTGDLQIFSLTLSQLSY